MVIKSSRNLTMDQEWKQVIQVLDEVDNNYNGPEGNNLPKSEMEDLEQQVEWFMSQFKKDHPSICKALDDYVTYVCIVQLDMPFEYP